MLSPPCPAALLRAAAAYAALEATSRGWLIARSSWSSAAVLRALGEGKQTPACADTDSLAGSPAHRLPSSWIQGPCAAPPWSVPQAAEPATARPVPRAEAPPAAASPTWHLLEPDRPPATILAANSVAALFGCECDTGPARAPCSRVPLEDDRRVGALVAGGRPDPMIAGRVMGGRREEALPAGREGAMRGSSRSSSGGGGGGGDGTFGSAVWEIVAARRALGAWRQHEGGMYQGGSGFRPTSRCVSTAAAASAATEKGKAAATTTTATTTTATTGDSGKGSGGGRPLSEGAQAQQPPLERSGGGRSSPPRPDAPMGFVSGGYDVASFPPERIRNFSIIAHVDHGKSTLADRLMEMTGALGARTTHDAQYLDKLQVEKERGITVKAQTASLVYCHGGVPYLLNLIDTPGHVDFSYEVSRSLAACQGALLVVDAGQGIQAQTVANFYLAFEQGLDLIPVVNKIDLPAADPRGCAEQMAAAFDLDPAGVLFTSAKTGQGMQGVLPAVIERIRPPRGDPSGPLRMLLFDAFHDEYRGVVLLVEVVDGRVEVGMRVAMASTGAAYEVQEVGLQAPERHPTGRLLTGQVGYLLCGIKDLKAARVGDTLYAAPGGTAGGAVAGPPPPRLPGFKPAKAMVFAGLFPLGGDGQEFESLATAMDKLLLNDASVVVKRENSDALGPGFRCGFLGMLHMEIFTQRLQQEYGASVVTTTPTVPYILELPGGTSRTLESAAEFPLEHKAATLLEPTVTATLIAPDTAVGRLMELCSSRRGEQLEHSSLGGGRTMLRYRLPLAELAGDFYSLVKSRSQGYASFDYEEGPYRPADLVRLDILAHGKPVDALARMVAREEAATIGRALLVKMRDLLDRQQFEVVLQAAANGKIVARETIKAMRKNVTAKCYGGDVTRKRKLLERQKEGKRRMKRLGSIDVPQELFPELMKTR